jgi:hypothetical protein
MIRLIVFLYLIIVGCGYVCAQQPLNAEYIVLCPTYGHKYAPYRFVRTISGVMEKREVTDSLLRNEPSKPTSTQGDMTMTGQIFKDWDIINNDTKEAWSLSEQEIGIAVKQDYYELKDKSFLVDSSAYYDITYENKFKQIAGYNCQKIVLTDKITKRQDSLYINKALNHLNFRLTKKYGKIDFIMQGFISGKGFTNTYSIVIAKEIEVPANFFEIPNEYKRFNSKNEYSEWWLEREKKRMDEQNKLKREKKTEHN